MLHLYYGRESIDKDRFIYDRIKARTILLVPDQFTLEAERDAFFYLKKKSLIHVDIMSFNHLAHKILQEVGEPREKMINKQGRHMLLAKVLEEKKKSLKIYGEYSKNTAFIEMANDFISEMKQYDVTPEILEEILGQREDGGYLQTKLEDIYHIFSGYEERIQGKYVDTEDYMSFCAQQMAYSRHLETVEFWIYGFESLTPKNLLIIEKLLEKAPEVHVVLSFDGEKDDPLFSLSETVVKTLIDLAKKKNMGYQLVPITQDYRRDRSKPLAHLERELFALPAKRFDDQGSTDETRKPQPITLVAASNIYSEGRTAAQWIRRLVQEKKIRYNEIALICNDLEERGGIYKRIFSQYGLPLFLDQKRSILHHPFITYLLALLDMISRSYLREDVFRWVKTGLTGIKEESLERLEQYTREYGIRGSSWKKPFYKGEKKYGQEELMELESARKQIMEPVLSLAEDLKEAQSVDQQVQAIYGFLRNQEIPQKLQATLEDQRALGLVEIAEESQQIWDITMDLFQQLVEILPQEKLSLKDFDLLLRAGFHSVEIGVLPPTVDGLILGTMERSRRSRVKALVVLGATDQLLPAYTPGKSLLSEEEKKGIFQEGIRICQRDELRMEEEKIAIYRNFAQASQWVWVSYARADQEGKGAKPSEIYRRLKDLFSLKEQGDIDHEERELDQVGSVESTLEYLAEKLREKEGFSPVFQETLEWYERNCPQKLKILREGTDFSNAMKPLQRGQIQSLFQSEHGFVFSPSRLERYAQCPFSHFTRYGLRPEEIREYEMEGLDMGDLYHRCFEKISRELTSSSLPINHEDSLWMTLKKEQSDDLVENTLKQEMEGYRDEIIKDQAGYRHRAKQMVVLCQEAFWAMIQQVRRGEILSMIFEAAFGKGQAINPIVIDLENREKVYIEGKIDRVDFLPQGYVKVIDYKSGTRIYHKTEATEGWKLQLFLYLRSVLDKDHTPAGAFYFPITQNSAPVRKESLEALEKKAPKERERDFRLSGIMVQDDRVIGYVDKDFQDKSTVLPLEKKKDGTYRQNAGLLEKQEFDHLLKEVEQRIQGICRELMGGEIGIIPQKYQKEIPCTYCSYRGICQFDVSFAGCDYRR